MIKNIYIILGTLAVLSGLGVITIHDEVFLPQSEAKTMLAKGKLLMEQHTEEGSRKAVEIFTTLASHFPDSEQAKEALYHLAESYEKLGNVDVAIGKYRRLLGLELDEEMVDKIRFKIARLQLMRHNSEEGLNNMMLLLSKKLDPSLRSDIYTEVARYYADHKNYEKALTNYEIALSEYPRNIHANTEIGDILFYQSKYEEALNQYKKVFRVFIDRNATHEAVVEKYIGNIFNKSVQVFRKELYTEAVEYFDFIQMNFPQTEEAEDSMYYLGNIYYIKQDYERAIAYFRKVIELPPVSRDENAFIKSGQSFYQLGEYKKAAMLFAKARDLFPEGKYSSIAIQWEEEAKKALAENYRFDTDNPETWRQKERTSGATQRPKSPSVDDNKIDFFRPQSNEPALENGTVVP